LSSIDCADRTFDIFRWSGNRLADSLNAAGMINPVLVESTGNRSYRIMSGFHRCEAALALSWDRVPVRILKSPEFRWTAFQHIVWIKSFQNDPHPVEWAGIVRIARILNQPPRQAIQDTLTPLGYPLTDFLFSLVIRLSDFPIDFLTILLRYPLSFRQVERLTLLSRNLLPKLAAWGDVLRIRTQELLEIGEQLDAFCRKVSPHDLAVWSREVESRILDPDLPRDERLQFLKDRLDHAVRPMLQKYRDKKRDVLRQLDIPPGMAISWDEDLERDDVTISLSLFHDDDLDRLNKTLMDPSFKENISKLLSSDD